jgi:hypothetical protein
MLPGNRMLPRIEPDNIRKRVRSQVRARKDDGTLFQASVFTAFLFGTLALCLYALIIWPQLQYGSNVAREMRFVIAMALLALPGTIHILYETTKIVQERRHRRRI